MCCLFVSLSVLVFQACLVICSFCFSFLQVPGSEHRHPVLHLHDGGARAREVPRHHQAHRLPQRNTGG